MLEIKRTALTLEANELMEMERVITDQDGKEALHFLRKHVYDRIAKAQQGRLKSHLDGNADPAASFNQSQE